MFLEDEYEKIDDDSKLSHVYFVQEKKRGFMYYIKESNGYCHIMEINPVLDKKHSKIFDIKSKNCLGFQCIEGNVFLFMDENKTVTKLKRYQESRKLYEVGKLNLKETDSHNFVISQNIERNILN